MKTMQIYFLFLFTFSLIFFLPFTIVSASVIEPWRPDIFPPETPKNAHSFSGSIILSDDYFELPLNIYYGILESLELKIRWGLIYKTSNRGISDMKFSVKYNFFRKKDDPPMIFLEGGVSLPIADHTKNLGLGGVGLSGGWYMIKEIRPVEVIFGIAGEFNDKEVLAGANPPRVFSYRAGARYRYDEQMTFVGELKGFNNYWQEPRGFKQELYIAPGIHYNALKIPLSATLLFGLTENSKKIGFYIETNFGEKN